MNRRTDNGSLRPRIATSLADVRAAMDACTVCYRQRLGYRQEGDQMVCNKCGQAFASNRINEVTGGCNPIPLAREVAGRQVIVRTTVLETAAIHY